MTTASCVFSVTGGHILPCAASTGSVQPPGARLYVAEMGLRRGGRISVKPAPTSFPAGRKRKLFLTRCNIQRCLKHRCNLQSLRLLDGFTPSPNLFSGMPALTHPVIHSLSRSYGVHFSIEHYHKTLSNSHITTVWRPIEKVYLFVSHRVHLWTCKSNLWKEMKNWKLALVGIIPNQTLPLSSNKK